MLILFYFIDLGFLKLLPPHLPFNFVCFCVARKELVLCLKNKAQLGLSLFV